MTDHRFRKDTLGQIVFFPDLPVVFTKDRYPGFVIFDQRTLELAQTLLPMGRLLRRSFLVSIGVASLLPAVLKSPAWKDIYFVHREVASLLLSLTFIGGPILAQWPQLRLRREIARLPKFPGAYSDTQPLNTPVISTTLRC